MRRRPLLLVALLGPVLTAGLTAGGAPPLGPPPVAGEVLSVAAATDGRGQPVVAWIARSGGREGLHAARLTGGAWRPLGGLINEQPEYNAAQPTVQAAPDGQVWLAWEEGSGLAHIDSYLMARWTGSAWTSPTPYALRRNLSDAGRSRSMTPGTDNAPLVGWTDIGTGNRRLPSVVVLREWRGNDWRVSPYANVVATRPAFMPSVAVVGRETWMAFVEGPPTASDLYVRAWDGRAWRTLGARLNARASTYIFRPLLRVAPDGTPHVAWLEDQSGLDVLRVARWTGRAWQTLGTAPVSAPGQLASSASLGFDARGRPVVAWNEGPDGGRTVRAARWDAGQWRALGGGPLNVQPRADTDHATLAAGAGGLLVAWRERGPAGWQMQVRKLE